MLDDASAESAPGSRSAMASPSSPHAFADRASLVAAVAEWASDATTAEATYGHISYWNVSRITRMDSLFQYRSSFNEPLHWDTSSVTIMAGMFMEASIFWIVQ